MIDNYIQSLKKGLNRNKVDYLHQNQITYEEMSAEHHEKRFVEYLGSGELRRFEMKGYE